MLDKFKNNQSSAAAYIKLESGKVNQDKLSGDNSNSDSQALFLGSKDSLYSGITLLKDSIKAERTSNKNSVNYDFSTFMKEESDSDLKFL